MSALVATFMWGALSAIFFAAGYYTRDRISKRRRAERIAFSSYGDEHVWLSHENADWKREGRFGEFARLLMRRAR